MSRAIEVETGSCFVSFVAWGMTMMKRLLAESGSQRCTLKVQNEPFEIFCHACAHKASLQLEKNSAGAGN
jgi:hypothetical protein